MQANGRFLLALVVAMVCIGGASTDALAYSGQGAANYADANWNRCPTTTYPGLCFSNDCTDFISQAMHTGGGYSFVNPLGLSTDDHNWYAVNNGRGWVFSHSWSVAHDQDNFQLLHIPGGYNYGTGSGTGSGSDPIYVGDLLFYDWGDGNGINHASIQVAFGTDTNSGWYGDLVDGHTSNRYHAIWSLAPYNAFASTTTVFFIHIDPNNH